MEIHNDHYLASDLSISYLLAYHVTDVINKIQCSPCAEVINNWACNDKSIVHACSIYLVLEMHCYKADIHDTKGLANLRNVHMIVWL